MESLARLKRLKKILAYPNIMCIIRCIGKRKEGT